ncbi:hypothetical protein ACFFQW_08375 [Umezawaea endophytica]|uniref:Uncharacterized protein n=1 Tax=Umezawaea endophytica TaxID=1654476 RepID=A0A9X2VG58_9PSEU|nr:hypothetical protein [Umezawaea endophytica]MCS7476000.1 hypothetical protein [Umezawaea endophytica]
MHTLQATAQATQSTNWSPFILMGLIGAMIVVLGLSRLLRNLIGVMSSLLISAGKAMSGITTVLTMFTLVVAVFMAVSAV